MRFHLEGRLVLSGDISKAASDIPAFIEEANATVLVKGAPAGKGARVGLFNVKGDTLEVTIDSDEFVRSHDALVRLAKLFGQRFGRKLAVGVRRVEADNYLIEMELEREPLQLARIPFVETLRFDGKRCTVTFGKLDEKFLSEKYVDRILTLIKDKVNAQHYAGKSEHWEQVFRSPERPALTDQDPTALLEKEGWIRRGASRGQWIFGPEMTRLFRTFERIVERELLEPLGFQEMIFPKLEPFSVWERSGHAKGIYPEVYYVCPPKSRDPAFWEEVIDHYRITNEVPLEKIRDRLDLPVGGMTYAQCPALWTFFQGRTIANDRMPIRVFDRSGTSHRYESGGLHGIERVDEFHRMELVWLGTRQQTVETATALAEGYRRIFEAFLELDWRMARVTPWFMAQERLVGDADQSEIGTTDYEGRLPYRKGTAEEWLEFQNVSVNGTKYPRGFTVKLQSGEPLWSGCSGIGLERWAAVFVAQKGMDSAAWPAGVRGPYGGTPRGIRFL
ncbi:MAG: serine--tRNA ligase [Euryarchaeota archaeon]|nr:serine--tRNA ligase [Euryarchaeota archaeon]